MKCIHIIFFLLFLSNVAFSQHKKIKKIRIYNTELQNFIVTNQLISFIEFSKEDAGNLALSPDTSLARDNKSPRNNEYELSYAGHYYLFKKQFGSFPEKTLLKILDSIKPKSCYLYWYNGKITAESIDIQTSAYCSAKSRHHVFRAVQHPITYPGGQKGFQNYLQARISAGLKLLSMPITDSVFFFRILVKKDSMVHEVKLLSGPNNELGNLISTALKESTGWTPRQAGGRVVNGYPEVFVTLKNNSVVEADFSRK